MEPWVRWVGIAVSLFGLATAVPEPTARLLSWLLGRAAWVRSKFEGQKYDRVTRDVDGDAAVVSEATASASHPDLPKDWDAARATIEQHFGELRAQLEINHQEVLRGMDETASTLAEVDKRTAAELNAMLDHIWDQQSVQEAVDARGFAITALGIVLTGAANDLADQQLLALVAIAGAIALTGWVSVHAWMDHRDKAVDLRR